MRAKAGRSVESLLGRMEKGASAPIHLQVKRPTPSQYRRNQRLTPEQRIDRAFALLGFASSLRKDVVFKR